MNGASSKNVNSQSETACLDQGEEVLPELITFSSGEAFFYLIPPAASYGHRAELWDVDAPAREVRVLLVLSSEDGVVRLLEHPSGVVFAECPLPTDGTSLTTVVEPVLDSSRYFVLRVAHRSSNNHAFIGVGFRSATDMAPKLVLKYFDTAGRAESARLLLALGEVPFTDEFLDATSWPALKPLTPFGQTPVLEVDGTLLGQSNAINLYCAKLAKLYPEDPLDAAKADMVVAQAHDCLEPLFASFGIKDAEEKLKKTQEALQGTVANRTNLLGAYLVSLKTDFFGGSKPNIADVITYVNFSILQSGAMDGIPTTILADFPTIKAHHARMAALPAIATYYKTKNNPKRVGFAAA
ncbi:MAG: hypothetical protein WDW38_009336 [Sanguina aurantia]